MVTVTEYLEAQNINLFRKSSLAGFLRYRHSSSFVTKHVP